MSGEVAWPPLSPSVVKPGRLIPQSAFVRLLLVGFWRVAPSKERMACPFAEFSLQALCMDEFVSSRLKNNPLGKVSLSWSLGFGPMNGIFLANGCDRRLTDAAIGHRCD